MTQGTGSPDAPRLYMTELRVVDWPAVVAWYETVLRLPVALRDDAHGFALLGREPNQLAVKAVDREPTKGLRLVFHVADLDAESARLAEQGVETTLVAENAAEAYREIRLCDPAGTAITLFDWTGRRVL